MDDTSSTSDCRSRPDPALRRSLEGYFAAGTVPGIVSARLFGSEALGRAHRESDVDVAVLLDRDQYPRRLDRSEARVDLTSGLIGATHRNEIDVVILNDLPPLFARRIVTQGVPLYIGHAEADAAFVLQTLLRAADLEPWLRRMDKLKLEALRR